MIKDIDSEKSYKFITRAGLAEFVKLRDHGTSLQGDHHLDGEYGEVIEFYVHKGHEYSPNWRGNESEVPDLPEDYILWESLSTDLKNIYD